MKTSVVETSYYQPSPSFVAMSFTLTNFQTSIYVYAALHAILPSGWCGSASNMNKQCNNKATRNNPLPSHTNRVLNIRCRNSLCCGTHRYMIGSCSCLEQWYDSSDQDALRQLQKSLTKSIVSERSNPCTLLPREYSLSIKFK